MQREWCVIGAGPSGLTAVKNLLQAGIAAECLEREDDIGGNWYYGSAASSVFESTRLISSKSLTEYTDFPMPRDWPAYPDHRQCLSYLRRYAAHFGLRDTIRPRSTVERIEPAPGGSGWMVHVAGRGPTHYAGVVIANGHNHEPRWPDIPGTFAGAMLHACQYKSPSLPVPLAGKRVLVIGAGNSGCDIAVEASHHAAVTAHSTRRGYFFVPRFILGRPADLRNERLLKMQVPLWLRRLISLRAIDRAIGLPWRHGLPRPDHRLWETHPIINEDLGRRIDAGAIQPRGNVVRFDGDHVVFVDGRREPFDIVICATGYKTVLPFVDGRHLGGEAPDAVPRLFLNLLHPTRDDIAVVGLIQPDSGQWGLTDLQGQLVAAMAAAAQRAPRAAAWLYTQRQRPPRGATIHYVDSPRHRLEVEHYTYRRHLQRLIKGMERRLRIPHSAAGRKPPHSAAGRKPPHSAAGRKPAG
jgi:hypothetical protein